MQNQKFSKIEDPKYQTEIGGLRTKVRGLLFNLGRLRSKIRGDIFDESDFNTEICKVYPNRRV